MNEINTILINNTPIQYQVFLGNYCNCKVIDSYKIISRRTQKMFLTYILENNPDFQVRSIRSYIREWRAHNTLFRWGVEPARTKDADLNINETKIRRFCYFFLSLIPQRKYELTSSNTTDNNEQQGEDQE